MKVKALPTSACVFVVQPLLCEANTSLAVFLSSPVNPSARILHLKARLYLSLLPPQIIIKNIKEKEFTSKDLTATYCCPHCFFSFRRSYSHSHRKRTGPGAPGSDRPSPTSASPHEKPPDLRCQHIWPG